MSTRMVLAVIALALLSVGAPEGIEKGTSVEGITEYVLDNGLRVLLFPDPSQQIITVNVTYLVGSKHENYGETGMAHLLEHLVFKGSSKHPDIDKELTEHGARANGTTWYERTNYYETFRAADENLAWALDLESDRMVNSFIASEGPRLGDDGGAQRVEMGENYPQSVLMERVFVTAYLWHNYGKSTIGARSDIENVPMDRLQAFYRKWYQPDNAILVVAGNFDEGKVLELIEEKFAPIPKPERELRRLYTVEPPQDGERSVTLRRVGDVQMVAAAYHIPAGTHPDFAALDLTSFILGDTPSGRLHKALVETKKAASVGEFAEQLAEPGMLMFFAEVRKEKSIDDARATLVDEIELLAETPSTAQEVQRAQASRLKNWEATMRNSEEAAIQLSEWAAFGDWRMLFLFGDLESLRGRSRIGELTAAMLIRGTANESRQEIQDELDRLKAQLSVGGGARGVRANLEVPREGLSAALRLLAEVLREPSFPASELELLKEEELAGREDAKRDPFQIASTAFDRHVNEWPEDDPRYVETPEEAIERTRETSLDEIRRFHADLYGASVAELTAVGTSIKRSSRRKWPGFSGTGKAPSSMSDSALPIERRLPSCENSRRPTRKVRPSWPAIPSPCGMTIRTTRRWC